MTPELALPKLFARFAAVAVVAVGASACSSVPHWVDPTNWIGGDDQAASDDTAQSNAATPDLASIPDKPAPPSTVDERKQVADTLKADRADAQYSADALRGGTEASAPPPVETAAPTSPTPADQGASASGSISQPAPAATDTASQPATTATADSASQPATATATVPANGTTQAADAANETKQSPPSAQPPAAAAEVASATPSPDATSAGAPASDDQLGFQPSKAPPLDPSVAHFVPPDVLNQYQQTTNSATTTAPTLTPPTPPKADPAQTSSSVDTPISSHVRSASANAPDSSVVADSTTTSNSGMVSPAAYTPGQQSQPTAVVFFARDAAVLGTKAKAQILAAAQSFQSHAGAGFIRVVGHSSSRTGDMPIAKHLAVVFEHSQDFATAVAHELIRDGVPADKVLIEAVGDSQPVYYESMPQGEAGNRRAEIFL